MDTCPKCRRALPPTGKCVYCGTVWTEEEASARRPSVLAIWGRWILRWSIRLAVLGGAAYLLMTEPGRDVLRTVSGKLALGDEGAADSPAVALVRRNAPGIQRLSQRPGSLRFEEEAQQDGSVIVTMIHQEGSALLQANFRVYVSTGWVSPSDAQADLLMRP